MRPEITREALASAPQAADGQTSPSQLSRRIKISAVSARALEADDRQVLPVGLECDDEFERGAAGVRAPTNRRAGPAVALA
jgi:hypothetical protein